MREETLRRREEILKAAMATFGSKGYHNGPLAEIAASNDGIWNQAAEEYLLRTFRSSSDTGSEVGA